MDFDRKFPAEKLAKLDSPARQARQPSAPLVELVAETAPRKIIDLGAGTGYFAVPIAVRLPDAIVTCIDLEPAMLAPLDDKATAAGVADRMRALLVSEREGAKLPLLDASVDLILLAQVYHELPDRPASLAECARSLVPGGRLVICDWSIEGTTEAGPPMDHRVPFATAEAEVSAAGFTALERHALYDDSFVLRAQRPA